MASYEKHASTYLNMIQMSLQFIFASILIHFRDEITIPLTAETVLCDQEQSPSSHDTQLSKLNAYYHSLQEKLAHKHELYKLDSILEDYLQLTKKYISLIESDSWSTDGLSDAFAWLNDKFLRKLIQMSAQIDAKDPLCVHFVKIFNDFTLLFAIDIELIKSKVPFFL